MKNLKNRCFTLIEIIVVIAVVAIVAALGSKGFEWARIASSDAATEAALLHVDDFIAKFKKDKGYYPQFVDSSFTVVDPVLDSSDGNFIIPITDETSVNYISKDKLVKMFDNYSELVTRGIIVESETSVVFMDAFGYPLQYRFPGVNNINSYDLFSGGADGFFDYEKGDDFYDDITKAGNNDNITNWK